jgi:16S rRNA (cytosine967-C5)-methyltransferase
LAEKRPGRRRPPAAAPRAGGASLSPARRAAFAVLERVAASDAHSDDLLHGPLLHGLSDLDRNLATALVLGTLRWQIALDARIATLLTRPDAELALPVRLALRLGAVQLLHFERIPRHAALNESVELTRMAGHAHASGMVNAVLRKLAGAPQPARKLHETPTALAERLGHPAWLVERWAARYGAAAAQRLCEYDQNEPADPNLFPPEAEGALPMPWMDDGSRLVAELAAAAKPDARRIWDCCAAPGGKTVVLGRRLSTAGTGAELLATDVSARRVRNLHQRLERELPGVRVEQADAAELPSTFGLFDLILCDVPCSGTGTLARNPEIRHRLKPADLSRQAQRQKAILHGALRRLARGGRLLYSTCSLEPEENEAVIEDVLLSSAGVSRVDLAELSDLVPRSVRDLCARGSGLLSSGSLRTLPGANFQGDGFFATLLERQVG